MPELERELRALDVAWPPTPALAAAVGARLEPRRRSWRRAAVLALATAAVALGAVLALSPDARSAFLELLRLQGAAIERRAAPVGFDMETDRRLGAPVTLREARERAGFDVLVPPGYASVLYDAHLGAVTFGWSDRRLFLTELRGDAETVIHKAAGPGTTVEGVDVDGDFGYWLEGERHAVVFRTAGGRIVHSRGAGNVLLWERGPLLLRLEGAVSLAEALELARNLRPADGVDRT